MHVLVWDAGRTHIAAVEAADEFADADLCAVLTEPSLCGRHPTRHAWAHARVDDDHADLCDRCARLAEGSHGYGRPHGEWVEA